jgi:hypothetical protein
VPGTNVDATKETGEPNHAGNPGGHSIWYGWTAPNQSGVVFIYTCYSAIDTVLGVYSGSNVNALSHVASNDDALTMTVTDSAGRRSSQVKRLRARR